MMRNGTLGLAILAMVSLSAQAQVENPNNPYDSYGRELRRHWLSVNATFSKNPCADKRGCLKSWCDQLNSNYHADPSAFLVLDRSKVKTGTSEVAIIKELTDALTSSDMNATIAQIKSIEQQIWARYGAAAEDAETAKWLMLIAANLRYVTYTFGTDHIVLGSEPTDPGFCWSCWGAAIDRCIGQQADADGPLDIIVNYGAGPGGWVLGTAAECAYDTFPN
jgi:hypothetical protein